VPSYLSSDTLLGDCESLDYLGEFVFYFEVWGMGVVRLTHCALWGNSYLIFGKGLLGIFILVDPQTQKLHVIRDS
jgi:hypothetical protein